MSRHSWPRRILTAAFLFCSVLSLLAAAISIQQHILRRRAERLLSDMRQLELRKSTWQDAQRMFTRWGAWGHYDGTCTPARCEYRILLSDFLWEQFRRRGRIAEHIGQILPPYRLFGGRVATVYADLEVVDGVVWGKAFGISVDVPPERYFQSSDHGYMLLANADSVSRFAFWQGAPIEHPDYLIGRPSGCKVCLAVYAKFTPYADGRDVLRLMDFNLSCLSRWRPCREQGDIMPSAWKQYMAEQARTWKERDCSRYPLELLGRDAENAVLADVVSRRPGPVDGNKKSPLLRLRLVQRLKRAEFWGPEPTQDLELDEDDLVSASQTAVRMSPKTRLLLLFSRSNNTQLSVWPDRCGVVRLTPENLAKVQRGIEQDYRATLQGQKHNAFEWRHYE